MKRILAVAIILLTLLPLSGIGDAAALHAQNFAYENGSYWIPDITVTGNDPSKVECGCCHETFDDEEAFARHIKHNAVCASYYYSDNNGDDDNDKGDDPLDGYCCFCGLPISLCTCVGVDVPGYKKDNAATGGGGSNYNRGTSGDNAPPNNTAKSQVSFSKLRTAFVIRGYDRQYNKKTCGYCLRGWKTVWKDAGIGEYSNVNYAKDFGPTLLKYGFKVIASGKGNNKPIGYMPQIGDTRVWENYQGQSPPAGHIDWWNGKSWVSDYKQNHPWLPGNSYRNVKYNVYR